MEDIPISSAVHGSEPLTFAELQQRQLDGYSDPSRLNPNSMKRNPSSGIKFHHPDAPVKSVEKVSNSRPMVQYDAEQAEFEALEAQLLQEQQSSMSGSDNSNNQTSIGGSLNNNNNSVDEISPSRVKSKQSTLRKRSQSGIRKKEIESTISNNSNNNNNNSASHNNFDILSSPLLNNITSNTHNDVNNNLAQMSYEELMNEDEELPLATEYAFPGTPAVMKTLEYGDDTEYTPFDYNDLHIEENAYYTDDTDVYHTTTLNTNQPTTMLNSSASVHDEDSDNNHEDTNTPYNANNNYNTTQESGWREIMYGKPHITSAQQQPSKKNVYTNNNDDAGQVVIDASTLQHLSNVKRDLQQQQHQQQQQAAYGMKKKISSTTSKVKKSIPVDPKQLDSMPPHLIESVEVLEQQQSYKQPPVVRQRCERLEQQQQVCMSDHQQLKKTIASVNMQGKQQKEAFLRQREKLELEYKSKMEDHKALMKKAKVERDSMHKQNTDQGVSRKERDELAELRREVERLQTLNKQQSSKFLNERSTMKTSTMHLQEDVMRQKEELHMSEQARIDAEVQMKKMAGERKNLVEEKKQLMAALVNHSGKNSDNKPSKQAEEGKQEYMTPKHINSANANNTVSNIHTVTGTVKKTIQSNNALNNTTISATQPIFTTPMKPAAPQPEAEEVLNMPNIQMLLQGATEVETIQHPCGKLEKRYTNGARVVYFGNGSRKIMWTNGKSRADFPNGDWKQTQADGTVVYFYRNSQTTHTTHTDGIHVYQFGDNQTETHFTDGRKEILFKDGTVKYVESNGDATSVFPNGHQQFQKAGSEAVLFQG